MAALNSVPFTGVIALDVSLLLTALYPICVVIYRLFFSPLAKIPGPWLTRISSVPEVQALKRQQRTQWVNSLFAQHPDAVAVRTGPNSVSFNHPDAIKAIYGTFQLHLIREARNMELWAKFQARARVFKLTAHTAPWQVQLVMRT